MTRVLLAVVAITSAAVAAPVPRQTERERIERLFGRPVDPDKDCDFKLACLAAFTTDSLLDNDFAVEAGGEFDRGSKLFAVMRFADSNR